MLAVGSRQLTLFSQSGKNNPIIDTDNELLAALIRAPVSSDNKAVVDTARSQLLSRSSQKQNELLQDLYSPSTHALFRQTATLNISQTPEGAALLHRYFLEGNGRQLPQVHRLIKLFSNEGQSDSRHYARNVINQWCGTQDGRKIIAACLLGAQPFITIEQFHNSLQLFTDPYGVKRPEAQGFIHLISNLCVLSAELRRNFLTDSTMVKTLQEMFDYLMNRSFKPSYQSKEARENDTFHYMKLICRKSRLFAICFPLFDENRFMNYQLPFSVLLKLIDFQDKDFKLLPKARQRVRQLVQDHMDQLKLTEEQKQQLTEKFDETNAVLHGHNRNNFVATPELIRSDSVSSVDEIYRSESPGEFITVATRSCDK